jgi:hypothetical protein
MTERPEVPDQEPEPPPEEGPELDPAGAEDDELENEPVHVDNQVPPAPPGVGNA